MTRAIQPTGTSWASVDELVRILDGANLIDLPAVPQTIPPTAPADEQRRTALLKVQVAMDSSTYSFATMVAR